MRPTPTPRGGVYGPSVVERAVHLVRDPFKFAGVSCHGELMRYAQRHVLAARAAETLDILVLCTNLENSAKELLDFLGLGIVEKLSRFDSDKDYVACFTGEERAAATNLLRELTGNGTAGRLLKRQRAECDADKMRAQTRSMQ